jgi:hypothetical protein
MTTALGVMQDLELRLGADLGARVGGEWRPFQSLSLAIEGGAHGQIYGDATAAIPYAEARLTLLVDSSTLKGRSSTPSPNMPMMPRTLPPNAPR